MRRAMDNLSLETAANGDGQPTTLEGTELRDFLLSLDDFEQMFHKVERRLRDARVVEALTTSRCASIPKPISSKRRTSSRSWKS